MHKYITNRLFPNKEEDNEKNIILRGTKQIQSREYNKGRILLVWRHSHGERTNSQGQKEEKEKTQVMLTVSSKCTKGT